jgi:Zn-dependent protease with chaperone function
VLREAFAADPNFWQRMIASSESGGPPAFLSDHPTDEQRVRNLEKWMPEAQAAYRQH